MTARFDRPTRWLGRLVLGTASVLAPLALAEAIARWAFEPLPPRRVYDPFAYSIAHPGLVDPFMGLEGEDVTVRMNELGMRGPSMATPVAAGTQTIVFLGGSTTENYGFTRAHTFPEQVGAAVAERLGTPIRVLNAGASGATTPVTLGRLQHQVVDVAPDLVVVMHAINDFLGGLRPGYRMDSRHLRPPPLPSLRPRSFFWAWAKSLRTPTRNPWPVPTENRVIERYDAFPARQAFARNLRSIVAVARAHNVALVLATQPTMYQPNPTPDERARYLLINAIAARGVVPPDGTSLARGMTAFNDTTRDVARSLSVPLVDLARLMPASWDLFVDECHYTAAGNAHMASLLAAPLEAALRSAMAPAVTVPAQTPSPDPPQPL